MQVLIAMPVYEDWESATLLCQAVDAELASLTGVNATVVMIDDGSRTKIDSSLCAADYRHLNAIRLLRLRRNLGHQRAIAVALAFIQQNVPCDAVIVMDSDGEDRPADIPRLLKAFALRIRLSLSSLSAEGELRTSHLKRTTSFTASFTSSSPVAVFASATSA
jgi:GT2 family glycosyltransferase